MSTDELIDQTRAKRRYRSIAAILLLVPAPSLGIAAALVLWPGSTGQTVFAVCKLWLIVFPASWFLLVERGRIRFSPPRLRDLPVALGTGIVGAAAIVVTYFVIGVSRIDPAALQATSQDIGIGTPAAFAAGAAYWIFVNSVIEEYVYRWFLLRETADLLSPVWAGAFSSAVFTIHHVIALNAYLDPALTALASTGIFIGGATWCWIYVRTKSLWPCWLSHAIIDLAVFGVGYWVIFCSS